jgi:outer membrane protein assembly factor BamB
MRKRSLVVLATALVLVCSGCWPARGGGGNRTSYNAVEQSFTTSSLGDVEVKWTFDEAIDAWQPYVTSAVVSREGGVHVMAPTNTGYRVFALDPPSGAVRWSQRLDSRQLNPGDPQSPPWVEDGRVYVSTQRDLTTIPDPVHGSTQVFDAATGEDLGVVGDGGDLQAVWGGFGVLVVRDSATNEGGTSGALYSGRFSADFAATPFRRTDLFAGVWSALDSLGGVTIGEGLMLHTGLGVLSSAPGPAQLGRALRAYPITIPGEVACGPVAPTQLVVECPAWVTPPLDLLPGSAPVVDPAAHRVYVSANFDGVRAFDIATGAEQWRGTTTVGTPTRTPALARGRLYAGTTTGVAAYDAAGCGSPTCPALWESGPLPSGEGSPGQAEQQPAVAGDVVFVPVMADGQRPRLVAFDADGCGQARCEAIWGVDLPGRVTGEIAISGGRIYVPTERGLVALGH